VPQHVQAVLRAGQLVLDRHRGFLLDQRRITGSPRLGEREAIVFCIQKTRALPTTSGVRGVGPKRVGFASGHPSVGEVRLTTTPYGMQSTKDVSRTALIAAVNPSA
jgi:hypothetical protein